MLRRPIALALALALLPLAAQADDLLQSYQHARSNDPQLASADLPAKSASKANAKAKSKTTSQP